MQKYGKTLNIDRFSPIFYTFAEEFNKYMKYLQTIFNITDKNGLKINEANLLQTAKDLLCAIVGNDGYEAFEDNGDTVTGYVQKGLYDEKDLRESIETFPLENVQISYATTDSEDKNWNASWEEHGFEPITIDGKCIVHDTMNLPPYIPEGAMEVTIDTKQAFGTGRHETTAMVISELLDIDLKGKNVLDCGCGTGILSIVAAKAGAANVTGYDIDEWSVENTRHNCTINGTTNVNVLHGDAKIINGLDKKFDIVTANINRNILLADMDTFKQALAKNGILILSGFYTDDAKMLTDKAGNLGMELKKQTSKNDWCALVFENKKG